MITSFTYRLQMVLETCPWSFHPVSIQVSAVYHLEQLRSSLFVQIAQTTQTNLPIQDDLLFVRSIIARLLGLFSSERLASEISAVTRVMVILRGGNRTKQLFWETLRKKYI